MEFVELNRCFVSIGKDEEPYLDIGRLWGRKVGGWLEWSDLRQHRRVVLLAEASSGKSAEFRNQAARLAAAGLPAFFVCIEELVDQGFESALEPGSVDSFKRWREGTSAGWFFLDSVDEARLNRKSFETALKRFARELGRSVESARVFISCRVSDWKWRDDWALIERFLPAWEEPKEQDEDHEADPLLDPIFNKKSQITTQSEEEPSRKPNELLVMQLVPLSTEQCRSLAAALGVNDVNTFVEAINQNGLDAFAERPGDLIDLAEYWKTHGRFASFAEMVEHNINRKLREWDAFRPDNEILSVRKARAGAERLAAALTLGKSFTLRTPGHDPDPRLASGALDPALILEEWTNAERNALVRRGIFAPSTYGRVRFHIRSTQEYLTAQWFHRLVQSNCPRAEVWDLIFASRYGVDTVVPSIRPAAAWLALRHSNFMEEIARREPLVLIRHGDPGSLPLEVRKRLLAVYAAKHAAAEIADDSIDHRALWMFAHPDLADAIREAWNVNTRSGFRMDLLRLIREGAIEGCVDLARGIALDDTAKDYQRIVALQSLNACEDQKGLILSARQILDAPAEASAGLAPSFVEVLYPRYLTTEQLLALIAESQPARKNAIEGFPYAIERLYDACTDGHARREFVTGLADLCLKRPFVDDYQRLSRRYFELAKHLEPIAKREVQALGDVDPLEYLVRLLMVVERAEWNYRSHDEGVQLSRLVQSNVRLQRALFWADFEDQRANSKAEKQLTRFWQIRVYGTTLWELGRDDLPWLYEDLSKRPAEGDKQIALSAIVDIYRQSGDLETEADRLKELVETRSVLKEALDEYLAAPHESEEIRKLNREREKRQRARTEKEKTDKASWVTFRQQIQKNPNQLKDPKCLRSWGDGAYRLWDLTEWLMCRVDAGGKVAPRQWRLLEEGFGRQVAEAYRDGMKILWRLTKPERPKHTDGGAITVKYISTLAFGAVGLEAADDPDWTVFLSDDEAKRAALHGCLMEQGYPEWLETLINSHQHVVLPVLKRCIRKEWSSSVPGLSDFLNHFGGPTTKIQPTVRQLLFEMITGSEPGDLGKLDKGLSIIKNLDLDQDQILRLLRIARRRLSKHKAAGRIDFALRYLAILLLLDPDRAIGDLGAWLHGGSPAGGQKYTERTFSFLFDRHDPIISDSMIRASVRSLEKLLRLAYFYVRPEHDIIQKGPFSPGPRDNAQSARNAVLNAVINRSGADAFRALIRVAEDPEYELRSNRFRELARGKAERDTEPPAWNPKEVVAFEKHHTAPVKTGVDLLRVVIAVLKDIQFQLDKGDVSSRPLLQRAKDEEEIQQWIVEQMNYLSRGRYNAYREARVAGGNMPDVIVSSTSAQCEVGIEIKHGGKYWWTFRKLERALRKQLATDYLKPSTRRHGVLVITNHRIRRWRDPETRMLIAFNALICRLDKIAITLVENDSGAIEVRCLGIDASPLKRSC